VIKDSKLIENNNYKSSVPIISNSYCVRNRKKIAEAINQLPVILNGGYQGIIGWRKKLGYDSGEEKSQKEDGAYCDKEAAPGSVVGGNELQGRRRRRSRRGSHCVMLSKSLPTLTSGVLPEIWMGTKLLFASLFKCTPHKSMAIRMPNSRVACQNNYHGEDSIKNEENYHFQYCLNKPSSVSLQHSSYTKLLFPLFFDEDQTVCVIASSCFQDIFSS
jgi:hypothetical protein